MADDLFDTLGIPQNDTTGAAPLVTPELSPDQLGVPAPMVQALNTQPQPNLGAPQQAITDPKQKLAMLATLGMMLGSGQRSGIGAGASQGFLNAQQILQQSMNAAYAHKQAEIDKQNALLAEQQRKAADELKARQAQFQAVMNKATPYLQGASSPEDYRSRVQQVVGGMQGGGFRVTPQWFFQNIPWQAPDLKKQVTTLLNGPLMKSPQVQELLKKNPDAALDLIKVPLKTQGSDQPDQNVTLREAYKLAGMDIGGINNGLLTTPIGELDPWKAAVQVANGDFASTFKRSPDPKNPKDQDWVFTRAKEINAPPEKDAKDHFTFMQGQDAEGKPLVLRGNTSTGDIAPVDTKGARIKEKAPNAMLANRLSSAKAVLETGADIKAEVNKNRKILGPLLSRGGSILDFVGAPPRGFQKLAGMIESYSLANLGVHGMRANNGAEAIKQTIGLGRHTPDSLIETIDGLNGFAQHLMDDNPDSNPSGRTPNGPTQQPAGIPGMSYQDYLNSRKR